MSSILISISLFQLKPLRLVILSEKTAQEMGVNQTAIGHRIDSLGFTLLDIIPGLPERQTNVAFDMMSIRPVEIFPDCPWCYFTRKMYVRLRENADVETLSARLDTVYFEQVGMKFDMSYILVPLRETRYMYPEDEAKVQYNHLRIFASVSVLVFLCAIFNYLMLFVGKIRIRSRELALRKVNGASNRALITLLLIETGLILLSALFIGGVLAELLYPWFSMLSEIEVSKQFLFREMVGYGIMILALSLLGALIPIRFFTKRSVSENIQPEIKSAGSVKSRFAPVSLFIQLTIGILLIFCTFLFLYQYRTLNATNIGFNRFNINSFTSSIALTKNEILKVPGVEDVIFFQGQFLPRTSSSSFEYKTESGEMIESEIFSFHEPDFIDFFEIEILEGRNLHNGEVDACLINEAAKRKFGFTDPIGKIVNNHIVVGVIADMYIDAPSLPLMPAKYQLKDIVDQNQENLETGRRLPGRKAMFSSPDESWSMDFNYFAYKYLPDHKASTEKAITKLISDDGGKDPDFYNLEEVYAEYTQSENYLLAQLSIMTVVVILIAVFGIYSMITLSCNQRRKEIAIRKVNGAKVQEIFMLFFRQYFWVTVVSSIVAFPVGVYIMQRWLEQYTRRVSMEWWLFAGIFVLVLLIVLASIFSRVNRAAKENPADVVKAE